MAKKMSDIWQPRRIIEERYRGALRRLFDAFIKNFHLNEIAGPGEIIEKLSEFSASELFGDFAKAAATRMVTMVRTYSERPWIQAMQKSGRGREIYSALSRELSGLTGVRMTQIVDENALLIKSIPATLAPRVSRFVAIEAIKGRRAEAIAQDLMAQFPDMAESRIRLIARTETSKASTALTRARSEELGLDWVVWRSSKDERVRESHRKMDGVIFNWKALPNPEKLNGEKNVKHGPYGPGEIWNCRCYPEPLVRVDAVTWPHKVFVGGNIRTMLRKDFERGF